MRDAVGYHFDCETLGVADCLVARLAITHHSRKPCGLCDPAAVFLAIQLDDQMHPSYDNVTKRLVEIG